MAKDIPDRIDFIFVDGDHSREGLSADWAIVKQKLRSGGVACLHDVHVPSSEPWRRALLGSVELFEGVIANDPEFIAFDSVHSLAVLRRV
jgi:predicted O-methyltransferase YrrM